MPGNAPGPEPDAAPGCPVPVPVCRPSLVRSGSTLSVPGSGSGVPGPVSGRGAGGMMLWVSGAGAASTLVGCGAFGSGRTTCVGGCAAYGGWTGGRTGLKRPGGRVGSSAPGIVPRGDRRLAARRRRRTADGRVDDGLLADADGSPSSRRPEIDGSGVSHRTGGGGCQLGVATCCSSSGAACRGRRGSSDTATSQIPATCGVDPSRDALTGTAATAAIAAPSDGSTHRR